MAKLLEIHYLILLLSAWQLKDQMVVKERDTLPLLMRGSLLCYSLSTKAPSATGSKLEHLLFR